MRPTATPKAPAPAARADQPARAGFTPKPSTPRVVPRAAAAPSPTDAAPDFSIQTPECRVYVGDCREVLPRIPEVSRGEVDLVFADPPFNWKRDYDRWKAEHPEGTKADYETWNDEMPEREYLDFTYGWIDACARALRPGGSFWINIPDDWAAEIACYMKGRFDRQPPAAFSLNNWCVWHYRFGQNTTARFINSKVHVFWFVKAPGPGKNQQLTWNPEPILEMSDRASTYFDPRTLEKKDGMPAGKRVPMDVWYGPFMGRVQGNNKERRGYHDNQLPEAYLERVVRCSSNEGNLVMDPFLGSGTTGVMAHALKRRFIGTEFSRANATGAFERIKLGPVRLGAASNAVTAIHKARKAGKKSRALFDGLE